MVSFDNPNFTSTLLNEAKIGLWKIETEEGKPQRLYANDTVYNLLGVDGSKLSPEDYYKACFDKIQPDDRANLRKAFRKMDNGNFTEAPRGLQPHDSRLRSRQNTARSDQRGQPLREKYHRHSDIYPQAVRLGYRRDIHERRY